MALDYEVAFIVDEVQTGGGPTGKVQINPLIPLVKPVIQL
jgi:acetylornithine/succinyldiaminopimelate/putrescine aminotransferase